MEGVIKAEVGGRSVDNPPVVRIHGWELEAVIPNRKILSSTPNPF